MARDFSRRSVFSESWPFMDETCNPDFSGSVSHLCHIFTLQTTNRVKIKASAFIHKWRVNKCRGCKRIQVSMLAPTMYPATSKLMRMNLPWGIRNTFYEYGHGGDGGNGRVCSYKSGGVVVLDGLSVAKGLQYGVGLQQLFLQFALRNVRFEWVSQNDKVYSLSKIDQKCLFDLVE